MKSSTETIHPKCVNASNPFHECGVYCREKLAQGPSWKDKKKSVYTRGKNEVHSKRPEREREGNIKCPKSSNPYHECNKYCPNAIANGTVNGESQRKINNEPVPQAAFTDGSFVKSVASSSHPSKSHYSLSSQQQSDDNLQNPNFYYIDLDHQVDSLATHAIGHLPKNVISDGSLRDVTAAESSLADGSDVGDSVYLFSDTYVSVGGYSVRPYLSATLQSILLKYGDIGANSSLESNSLRSFHLECICSVVRDLQTTSFELLTKAKVKETIDVLKNAESVQIDVAWLRKVVNEQRNAISIGDEYRIAEKGKEECDQEIELIRRGVKSLEEELSVKEGTVTKTKDKIDEMKRRLKILELEATRKFGDLSSDSGKK